jgi:hypothetical protein
MRKLSTITLALAALAVAAVPATAAKPKQCSRQATVDDGTVLDMTTAHPGPDGQLTLDQTAVRYLKARHAYTTTATARFAFDGVVYTIERGAVFNLSCFGHSKADGAKFPSLVLHVGEVAVAAKADKPGAVTSNEVMFDPYQSKAISFTVTRTVRGAPSFQKILADGPSATRFGVTEVRKLKKAANYLNITPYVGPRSGTCRQAKGGVFSSRKIEDGYYRGSSEYYGLARFSTP